MSDTAGASRSRWMRAGLASLAAVLSLVASAATAHAQASARVVKIGYQPIAGPWIADLRNPQLEAATGRKIEWIAFSSAPAMSLALDDGAIQLALMSSSGIAAAASRDLEIEVVWILREATQGYALAARPAAGIDPANPATLAGKRLAVPYFTAAHLALLAALPAWKLEARSVQLVNVAAPAIGPALEAGIVDAAYVTASEVPLLPAGRDLRVHPEPPLSAPPPVFDAIVADRAFVGLDRSFLVRFIRRLAEATDAHAASGPTQGSAGWVATAAGHLGLDADAIAAGARGAGFPTLSEQRTAGWLGGGRASGAGARLKTAAQLLHASGRVAQVHDDYAVFISADLVEAAASVGSLGAPVTAGAPTAEPASR